MVCPVILSRSVGDCRIFKFIAMVELQTHVIAVKESITIIKRALNSLIHLHCNDAIS